MIKSEMDEKHEGCSVEMAGCYMELTKELGALFDAFSKRSETKEILLTVIDAYLGKELKSFKGE